MTVANRAQQKTEDIIKEIEEVLEENTSVKQLENNRLIQINNLDGITSKEEMIEVIYDALGMATKDVRIIVRNLQVCKYKTQTANVLILESDDIKFLKKKEE